MKEQPSPSPQGSIEAKIAHLGFIQGIITRLASNSFLLKGWAVTLVVAILTLSAEGRHRGVILLSYLPVLMFWWLDAYFLRLERLYRRLYEEVAANHVSSQGFSLDATPFANELPADGRALFSPTLKLFYGSLLVAVSALLLLRLR